MISSTRFDRLLTFKPFAGVREFARWAPSMRVVPYSGDVDSRRIIEEFELFDASGALKTRESLALLALADRLLIRFLSSTDVVLATYEALEKNIHVFRNVQRWDCLVVDEGQRLKSGPGGHLWDALETLNINHRVLLSGESRLSLDVSVSLTVLVQEPLSTTT